MAISIADIKATVAQHFGLPLGEIASRDKIRRIARPRQIAMALAYAITPASYPAIGRQFDRDSSTVVRACQKVVALCETDPVTATDVRALLYRLTSHSGGYYMPGGHG